MSAGEFEGLAAVVTGGGSGIGLAVARTLADRGAKVAALDLDPGGVPAGMLGLRCDVTDEDSVRAAVRESVEHHGGLDVLVNNAGIGAQGTVETNSYDEWRRVFDVNVLGIVRTSRAALPHLRRSAAASIVNTCSIAATAGLPDRAAYSASKGAVLSLTQAMAADHLAEGVRVNCVNPGTADTPWVRRLLSAADDPDAELAALNARQPSGRLVSADEVAAAIAYLAGPAAGATTGTTLAVDGGMQGLRLRK
ncbi:SDR family NAD(P)-dependent oxidoreductase [Saccharopolyspora endophytica]|uniref:SDR family oxidoreductase n=1 Tax=Saccharopolyspora endophytica TaxID=543886 RepID=A0ABS5DCF7_9PSEU|nr:SDR family oxidoreductase [Saccharopolyspora endophytica]MBQ0923971.1 SDR family oxidoreductase [Saccharopolyspora endophytica]